MEAKGTLIAIGGNEDKGDQRETNTEIDFIEEGILSHVVAEAGGLNAKIKVITSASSVPLEVGEMYMDAFEKLNCSEIEILHIDNRDKADLEHNLSALKEADAVMFSGGDQSRISDFFSDTEFHKILLNRYQQEEFVIAGTSAGAVAMSQEMIYGGSSEYAMLKGAVKMRKGLGLLPEVIFDTHFIRRGRFGRLTEAIGKFPRLLGVGLGEDTGIIIRKGAEFQTIGSGMVLLFDGSELKHNNVSILSEGTPITIGNMIVHVMANNDHYDLRSRKLTALPVSGKFV